MSDPWKSAKVGKRIDGSWLLPERVESDLGQAPDPLPMVVTDSASEVLTFGMPSKEDCDAFWHRKSRDYLTAEINWSGRCEIVNGTLIASEPIFGELPKGSFFRLAAIDQAWIVKIVRQGSFRVVVEPVPTIRSGSFFAQVETYHVTFENGMHCAKCKKVHRWCDVCHERIKDYCHGEELSSPFGHLACQTCFEKGWGEDL